MKRSWTDEQLRLAISNNIGYTGVMRDLGLGNGPGNWRTVKSVVNALSIDTSHFTGKRHGTSRPKFPLTLDMVLTTDSKYASGLVKRKLLKSGVLNEVCSRCGLGNTWQNERIVLQLDHINGDSFDNTIDNLRILCPNCHSQTPTFKNKKHSRYSLPKATNKCIDCSNPVSTQDSERCWNCYCISNKRFDWPDPKLLHDEVIETSYKSVSDRLGVRPASIKKFLIKNNLRPNIKRGPKKN